MIRGAIFDIDGTLIDSMKVWDDLGARYLISIGVTPEPDLARILFPLTLAEGCAYIKEHYHLRESEKEIETGIHAIFARFYREEVMLKPGAERLLRLLDARKIPMVLATVGDTELEIAALTRLGVFRYFRKLFNCSDYRTSKREPLIYEKAASYLGTKPQETLVFEDTFAAVHSAKMAGFRVVAVQDEASLSDREKIRAEADIYLENFDDLSSID